MEVTLVSIVAGAAVHLQARHRSREAAEQRRPDHSRQRGAPKFIDALAEAADRAAKDKKDKKEKGNYFPVFMMVGSSGVEGSNAARLSGQQAVQADVQRAPRPSTS